MTVDGTSTPGANIIYKTGEIARYYESHRTRLADFYKSERWIFQQIADDGGFGDVLDVGCAVGGLGQALAENYVLASYTGVDVNTQAIALARQYKRPRLNTRFLEADIITVAKELGSSFHTVVSLSCADWNVDTRGIVAACWDCVAPGGRLVLSLRLTKGPTIANIAESCQLIAFDGNIPENAEVAPYVVFNRDDAISLLTNLRPEPRRILGYGYWGSPSQTARTPFDEIFFTVLAVTKGEGAEVKDPPILEFHGPWSNWEGGT